MQKSGSSSNDSHGNCVVLVCINNKSGKVLTHDKFFKIFSPFGTIQRILIFERGAIWKTFVEFDNSESAYKARVNLNGLNFGDEQMKMNVYASQLERIQFQENNSGGVDYTLLRQKMENKTSAVNTPQVQQSFLKYTKSPVQTPNSLQQKSPFSQYSATTPFQQPDFFQQQQMFFNQQQMNLQFMQQQLFLQQQMQSLVQRLNQLMFMLQQINNEQQLQQQFYYTQMIDQSQQLSQIEKQQSLLKEMNDIQKQLFLLTEQYSNMLKSFQSAQSMQLNQTFGQSPKIYQSPAPVTATNKFNVQVPSSPYQTNTNGIQLQRKMSDSQIPIQFVTTVQDADVTASPKQVVPKIDKMKKKDEGSFQGLSSDELLSKSEDEKDNEEHAQMCKVFKNDDQQQISDKDAREIYNKTLNIPENNQEESSKQQILSMLENHIQQNANDKVSLNIEQIDELINKSKNKNDLLSPYQNVQKLFSQLLLKLAMDSLQQEYLLSMQQQMMTKQMYDEIEDYQDPAEYVNPLFLKVVRKSKVIYARWFDKKNVTLRMLYNIFSTYGNIEKMIFLKERSSVLVQYENIEYASQAKEALNDIIYFGQSIKIFFSNYEEIYLKNNNLEKGEFKEDPNSNEEYFQGCLETNRFQPGCIYSFTSPSDSLQLSNLSKQSCTEEIIQSVFDPFGKIQKMKFMSHPNDKNVCILKYDTVEQSLTVLSHLHGVEINERIIHIQFTKLKL